MSFAKIIISAIIFLCAYGTKADPIKIIASSSPIASIISLITKDKAQITSMCNLKNQCPHHYKIKPGQIEKISDADLVVYIDDSFEIFMHKLLERFSSKEKILKLSAIPKMAITINNQSNWHIWLSINNIRIICEAILASISKIDPSNIEFYNQNYNHALKRLEELERMIKEKKLKDIDTPLILDASLEHFFSNFKTSKQIARFYSVSSQMRPEDLLSIQAMIKIASPRCIFVSAHQDVKRLKAYFKDKVDIIAIESESWSMDGLYDKVIWAKMSDMINQVANCL